MIFGGVLIGGSSRRMGRAKAGLRFEGRAIVDIVKQTLSAHCEQVFELGPGGLDDLPGLRGPKAGILAARAHAPEAWWVVAACDMPLISEEALSWLLAQERQSASVVMPRNSAGILEPTFALYGPGSESLLRSVKAPMALEGREGVLHPQIPGALMNAWTNVNTPAEFASLQAARAITPR